ncbi:MAG: cellulase family glycosylhydrolase [Chloroflexi bacterium]|nr:cellulase family glycosylhydrolase [Chloroflexota bacterium]
MSKLSLFKCLIALTLITSAFTQLPASPVAAAPNAAGPHVAGTSFVGPDGRPFFVLGVNYEGHTDRAWHMWEANYFDPGLVEADLTQAQNTGFNAIRIFVQGPLRDDIQRGDFSKLDKVVGIAKAKGLYVLITLYDYEDRNLQAVADIDGKIAAHYAGEAAVLGYDLKNEPQFGTIAFATYPAGSNVPLQTDALIKQYGEKMSRADAAAWRSTGEGKGIVPSNLSDEQAYYFANNYEIYKEFLSAGELWVAKHAGKSSLDYMDSADSAEWRPFLDALSTSLATWIDVQRRAVQSADPNHPVTVSYSNLVLAKLPANGNLGFLSPHRFSDLGLSSFNYGMNALENLRATFPGLPIVLSEFGYSNASGSLGNTTTIDQQNTAAHEAATWLYLYSHGFAGGLKWMLNNYSNGYNPRENAFGVFDNSGNPKITYYTTKAISAYVRQVGSAAVNGSSLSVTSGPSAGTLDYSFTGAGGAFGTGGALASGQAGSGLVRAEVDGNGQVAVDWGLDAYSGISAMSTLPGKLSLRLDQIVSGWDDRRAVKLSVEGGGESQLSRSPGAVAFAVEANRTYRLDLGHPPGFRSFSTHRRRFQPLFS